MQHPQGSEPLSTRRNFLKTTGQLAAASALAGVALPHVHAASSDVIGLALIGCGGRGTGAAAQALNADSNVEMWAMGEVFRDKIDSGLDTLKKQKIPAEQRDYVRAYFDAIRLEKAGGAEKK